VATATKGGHVRGIDGNWSLNGSPKSLRHAYERSLADQGVYVIDLYLYHCPDPAVPSEDSFGCPADLQQEGKIRHIRISNASTDLIRRATTICRIAAVQNVFRYRRLKAERNLRPVLNWVSPISHGDHSAAGPAPCPSWPRFDESE
jgi:aryl-alcohol dehydrogenase-like predicted oxidoreductase